MSVFETLYLCGYSTISYFFLTVENYVEKVENYIKTPVEYYVESVEKSVFINIHCKKIYF